MHVDGLAGSVRFSQLPLSSHGNGAQTSDCCLSTTVLFPESLRADPSALGDQVGNGPLEDPVPNLAATRMSVFFTHSFLLPGLQPLRPNTTTPQHNDPQPITRTNHPPNPTPDPTRQGPSHSPSKAGPGLPLPFLAGPGLPLPCLLDRAWSFPFLLAGPGLPILLLRWDLATPILPSFPFWQALAFPFLSFWDVLNSPSSFVDVLLIVPLASTIEETMKNEKEKEEQKGRANPNPEKEVQFKTLCFDSFSSSGTCPTSDARCVGSWLHTINWIKNGNGKFPEIYALYHGITTEFCPCNMSFVFANSETETCRESCIIHFPTTPPCSTRVVLETGRIRV